MKRITFLLTAFFLINTNAKAQFVGSYNLHDGGLDMPNSQLYILPNNEFVLFYFAGYKEGKWKQINENSVELLESKTNNLPYLLFGEVDDSKNISIDVYSLYGANAMINFSSDTTSIKEFQPLFNSSPNCLADDFTIQKKKHEYKFVTLTLPKNPDFGILGNRYPYNAIQYTFPFENKYNKYVVLYNADATRESLKGTLSKKNDDYFIFGESKLKREELTEELLAEIEKGKKATNKSYDFSKYGTQIFTATTDAVVIYKPTIEPIFTSYCEGEKTNSDYQEKEAEEIKLIPTNRENGFYTILNFDDSDYQIENYELAKVPSLAETDIQSVKKIVSDYGGYEIEILFTESGTKKFAELTAQNINKPLAIVVNKTIISAPNIASEITGGRANITGGYSESQIDEFVAAFKK